MKQTSHRAHNDLRGGFTLLEIVVALAILGTSLVILLETHYAGMSMLADAQDTAFAQELIQVAVAESERGVLEGHEDGEDEFGKQYPGYSYTYAAVQVDEENQPGLFDVTVTVLGFPEPHVMRFFMYDGNQVTSSG